MNRDEAREHFKNSGLSYVDITEEDISSLFHLMKAELAEYFMFGGEHAQLMNLRVRKPLKKHIKVYQKTGLRYAYLKVKGSYFDSREAISFNENGFIGFGGELDDKNVQPIISAFCRWCDLIADGTPAKEAKAQ
ncbi:hypothetical protein M3204_14120 [Mesobacillus subterraneus]|uniref:hypothetical protein n=1 Tax=Mesobacillus subterraneus TaxID=285983 RepID=UPI00203F55FA|nr:hypothetical protein [Mesobacillus subterraneus]MCM3665550.1 hypothetical protein [Mesobacillus subterraneus]MCM3686109.1 hypothetical protein [Mesobacillus subterraneus]